MYVTTLDPRFVDSRRMDVHNWGYLSISLHPLETLLPAPLVSYPGFIWYPTLLSVVLESNFDYIESGISRSVIIHLDLALILKVKAETCFDSLPAGCDYAGWPEEVKVVAEFSLQSAR
jgi:hypothetical protein